MKIIGIIPAHLASIRLKRKILLKFEGLEMLEHVRRRALISKVFSEVYVATGDDQIEDLIKGFGGNVIRTKKIHTSGTSRVAEAISNLDATHIVLIQGDEPLMLPQHLKAMINAITLNPDRDAWNATANLDTEEQLDKNSFVKCSVTDDNRILYCFRRSPSSADKEIQFKYIKKILGLIAYRRQVLEEISLKEKTLIETVESIEQLRLLINNYSIYSVPVSPSLPSVNEPGDEENIYKIIEGSLEQKELLKKVLSY